MLRRIYTLTITPPKKDTKWNLLLFKLAANGMVAPTNYTHLLVSNLRKRSRMYARYPSVFIGYDTQSDFEVLHGPLWKQVATMLTGTVMETN